MSGSPTSGTLLIAPHQFPDVERELRLAADHGLDVVVAADQAAFSTAMPTATVVMVTPYARVGKNEIDAMRQCKGIVRYGIGYDNIDVAAATQARVPISIVPDASTEEVASHAFAMGLALIRRIPAGQASVAAGTWASAVAADLPVLSDLTVGVVGMGRIGRMVAQWWAAVGARVVGYDPIAHVNGIQAVTLADLLSGSDVISLHVPMTPETKHMISSGTIAEMKDRPVIVNVSRGGLIDEQALAAALVSGRVAGAALDVFEAEPLPRDNPLRQAPNAILTPHAAWKSRSSLAALQAGAVDRARALLDGRRPMDLVTA
ncbi:C-terminal binding protein [Kineococcus sp. SYSU DK004]|uniref:C-terminal binding protein n=1 Tax=Kineococcus sp. SYSU DK004 TaxID=3383125 RepID=UPI003D7CBC19